LKEKNYHLDKTNHFSERGIRIIHIWEDDWTFKKEILKSQIRNWIGNISDRVFARKCVVSEIKDINVYREFLDKNHIQGYVRSSVKIGLYYNNELVSLMVFDQFEGRRKMSDREWNLSRFCNRVNTNVVGSASKLLKYFIKEYKPKRIISYADKDWSFGNIYDILGFKKLYESKPDYKYVDGIVRINKQQFTKKKLAKLGYNDLSESEITSNIGLYKVYNCGQLKFELLIKN